MNQLIINRLFFLLVVTFGTPVKIDKEFLSCSLEEWIIAELKAINFIASLDHTETQRLINLRETLVKKALLQDDNENPVFLLHGIKSQPEGMRRMLMTSTVI